MQNAVTPTRLTKLEHAVLETVVYSDLFDYPLTVDEVWRWLPVAASRDAVEALLRDSPELQRHLRRESGYVMLAGRENVVGLRRRRGEAAVGLKRRARFYGGMIARLPFVRLVALTGSLPVDNADDDADFDYLVVTAPGRVWLARAMMMALGRLAALRGVTLCPNYILSEAAIALPSRDPYTARELLQMEPISGFGDYQRMLEANAWWRDWLPNAAPAATPAARPPALSRRAAEALLRTPPFDLLERWLLNGKGRELRAQAESDEAVFDEHMCKGHFDAWREQTRRRSRESMQRLLEVTQ